ncbi:MAG TPA: tryptophan synthase subunit alpha [Candidatus Limnocylindrales bacterium]|nr:tryptophan synthase subunit alpha [Candidatus Limnocylindrales bacterium]
MNRIAAALTGRQSLALLAYVTVGYPTPALTPALVKAIADAGADLIELGIPFSDPLADGPTIQASSQAALRQGVTVAGALEVIRQARALTPAPMLVMSYLNPILAYGIARFCRDAVDAGVDGLIVPDLPPGEAGELRAAAADSGLGLVFFVSPTSSPERMRAACDAATAFVYCIAVTGTTGARDRLDEALLPLLDRVRACTTLPIVVGFGISRPEHLQALQGHADGAIVASALLDAIARAPEDPVGAARRFVIDLRQPGV